MEKILVGDSGKESECGEEKVEGEMTMLKR